MKIVHFPMAGAMALALAACGGGGGGDTQDFVVSSGLLELELPTEAERADFSTELDDAVDAIALANEEGTGIQPSSSLFYDGVWGAGIDNEDETLVSGSVSGSFSASSGEMVLSFLVEEDDDPDIIISGDFSAMDMVVDANGIYDGTLAGSFHVSGDEFSGSYDIDGTVDGAVTANETFGAFEGIATNIEDSEDAETFGGLFFAPVDPI